MQGIRGCALLRHRPFRADGVCLFCNPDFSPETLGAMLADPEREAFYQALHQGKECHSLKCQRVGQFDDGIGHWWCKEHIHQCLFLRAGAAREWAAWDGMKGGRPAWYARMVSSNPTFLAAMLATLVDARDSQELERYVEEYASNALEPREGSRTMVAR